MRILIAAACLALATPAAANDWLSYDGVALNPTSKTGVVVVGLDYRAGGDPSYFNWRAYDPASNRLNERRFAGAGAAFHGLKPRDMLFAMKTVALKPNRILKGDQRLVPGADGVGFRMTELPPGDYVLEGYQVNAAQNRVLITTFEGPVPVVRVEAGKVAYAGNISFKPSHGEGAKVTFVSETPDAANAFLRMFPKIEAQIAHEGARRLTLRCVGRKTPLLPDLHCDREKSTLAAIASEPAGTPTAALAVSGQPGGR